MSLKKNSKKFSINTEIIYNPLNKKEIIEKNNLTEKNSNQFLKKNFKNSSILLDLQIKKIIT